jgi:hypothetical protein
MAMSHYMQALIMDFFSLELVSVAGTKKATVKVA